MQNKISCSIVLPCYNPQPGWAERVIEQYALVNNRLGVTTELVLVNDGSTFGIAQDDIQSLENAIASFRYISYNTNKGKGYALRRGAAEAASEIIIYTDVDFPYTIESIAAVYETLATGEYDAAPGIKKKDYYAQVPTMRRYISRALRFLTGLFFRIKVTDTQCGLKGFTQQAKHVFLSTTINRYLFDLEFVRALSRGGYRMKAVPVQLTDDVVFRRMNYRVLIPEMFNFLKIMLRS